MARYKLVRLDNGRLITGEELRQQLLSEGFTVPVIQPLVRVAQVLPKPVRPLTQDKTAWANYAAAADAYTAERVAVMAENKIREAAYFKQFTDFAGVLQSNFVLATGIYDRSTRTWNYSIIEPCLYSYKQAADKLLGAYRPAVVDPINFICNSNF